MNSRVNLEFHEYNMELIINQKTFFDFGMKQKATWIRIHFTLAKLYQSRLIFQVTFVGERNVKQNSGRLRLDIRKALIHTIKRNK